MEKYREAVFIVTYARKEGEIKYLLLKRKLHWIGWEFPKGGKKFYETPKMAVKREISEETGKRILKIDKFDFAGKYKYKEILPDRKNIIGQTFILFSAEIPYGDIKISNKEHTHYKWVSFKEAMKKLTWKNQKQSLKIVNDFLKNKN